MEWKQLYIDIRRLHRKLPPALKYLGNGYIKAEFRLHRDAQQVHLGPFLQAWASYRNDLKQQLLQSKKLEIGRKIEDSLLDALTPTQLGQLLALRETSKKGSSEEEKKS